MGAGARGLRAMAPGRVQRSRRGSASRPTGRRCPSPWKPSRASATRRSRQGRRLYRVTYGIPAPETTITSGPAAHRGATTATFQFTATEPGARFECALDARQRSSRARARRVYSALAAGAHAFQVRATGIGGTDASPATWNWTIALPVPDTSIATGPAAASTTTAATFQFTATLAGADVRMLAGQRRLRGLRQPAHLLGPRPRRAQFPSPRESARGADPDAGGLELDHHAAGRGHDRSPPVRRLRRRRPPRPSSSRRH